MSVVAVIPAAGKGERMGKAEAKPFLPLRDKPLIAHALIKFDNCPRIDCIVAVVAKEQVARTQELILTLGLKKVGAVVPGGSTRQESVAHGLEAAGDKFEVAVIHDGARPLVPSRLIEESIEGALKYGAVAAAVTCKDTVRIVNQGWFVKRLNREEVTLIQTPQAFLFPLIKEAYRRARQDGFLGTDDASLVEHIGKPVWMVPGSYDNIKITTPEDLLVAEALLRGS